MGRILWVAWDYFGKQLVAEMFQSPDQWGGYCGLMETNEYLSGRDLGFNPLTNGADIVGGEVGWFWPASNEVSIP